MIGRDQVSLYRETLVHCLLYAIVLPHLFLTLLDAPLPMHFFANEKEIVNGLPPRVYGWKEVCFWYFNTAWFLWVTVHWRYSSSGDRRAAGTTTSTGTSDSGTVAATRKSQVNSHLRNAKKQTKTKRTVAAKRNERKKNIDPTAVNIELI